MLAALASGYALRRIANRHSVSVDDEHQRSTFGTAAHALLLGCVERVDDHESSGLSIEDAVHDLIYSHGPTDADTKGWGKPLQHGHH